jgi:hypothetical protein
MALPRTMALLIALFLICAALIAFRPVAALAQTRTCDVTRYGADFTGQTDSTVAIRSAITDCAATTGPDVVSFPAGTYKLDLNDGLKFALPIDGPNPIAVVGAGQATTRLVEWVGTIHGQAPKSIFNITVDGVSLSGLTLDTQTFNAGDAFRSGANSTTVSNSTILGSENPDVFALRFNGPCTHSHLVRMTNNYVHDIAIDDQGVGGNAGLDFSCQAQGRIENLRLTGSMLALYIDSGVSVSNFTFTPGATQRNPRGWYITGPSDHISIDRFTTSGQGGIIGNGKGDMVTDTTITNEQMTVPGFQLVISNALRTSISGSSIGELRIAPSVATDGLTVTSSTLGSVVCSPLPGARITGLSGMIYGGLAKQPARTGRPGRGRVVPCGMTR